MKKAAQRVAARYIAKQAKTAGTVRRTIYGQGWSEDQAFAVAIQEDEREYGSYNGGYRRHPCGYGCYSRSFKCDPSYPVH